MGRLVLVRHGQASFDSDDYDRLSEIGKQQSQILGAWLSHCQEKFDAVFAGRLLRHRETAELCLQQMASGAAADPLPPMQFDAALNEYEHDEILLRHRPDFVDRDAMRRSLAASDNPAALMRTLFMAAMARWGDGNHDQDYSESWPTFATRCIAGVNTVAQQLGDRGSAVVFTSGGVISTVVGHTLGLSPQRIFELNWSLANSGVTTLSCRKGRLRLISLNNTAHIDWSRVRNLVTFR